MIWIWTIRKYTSIFPEKPDGWRVKESSWLEKERKGKETVLFIYLFIFGLWKNESQSFFYEEEEKEEKKNYVSIPH